MRNKQNTLLLSLIMLFGGCGTSIDQNPEPPRIAIAGLAIESSTFSPAVTQREAFHPKTGEDIFSDLLIIGPF